MKEIQSGSVTETDEGLKCEKLAVSPDVLSTWIRNAGDVEDVQTKRF